MNEPKKQDLPRWIVREPNDKEFEHFKKSFFSRARLKEAEKLGAKEGIKMLLLMIGELQSENSELRYNMENMPDLKTEIAKHFSTAEHLHKREQIGILHKVRQKLLNDVLFYELKLGVLYQ